MPIIFLPWSVRRLTRMRSVSRAGIAAAAALVRRRSRRGSGREAALVLLGAVAAAVAIEAGYRVVLYRRLLDQFTRRVVAAASPNPTDPLSASSVFDPHTGHRYKPNLRVDVPPLHPGLPPWRWGTNAHGHVADDDYPVAKPAGEFRVAAVGDSFTAGVTNAVRWPAELEALLNADPAWEARVGGRRTRVINHGLDGIGVVQFPAVFEHDARRFEPDLVLVSLILDTLYRRPYSRGRPHDVGGTAAGARAFVAAHLLAPLPWWNPTPELLARSPAGRRLGLRPRLDPESGRTFDDPEEAMAAGLAALRAVRAAHPRVVILHHPMAEEVSDTLSNPGYFFARDRLRRDGPAVGVVEVGRRPPFHPPDPDAARRWYQLPHDPHPTDDGLRAYA